MQPIVKHINDRIRLAHWHRAVICVIDAPLEVDDVALMDGCFQDLLARRRGGVMGISIVSAEAASTSSGARGASARMMKRLGNDLRRTSLHVEGGGILVSLVGTLVRGMRAMIGSSFNVVMLPSMDAMCEDAASALRAEFGVEVSPADVASAITAVRSAPLS